MFIDYRNIIFVEKLLEDLDNVELNEFVFGFVEMKLYFTMQSQDDTWR
jgi:hypothetical protein